MYFIKAVATSTARRLSFCLLAVGFLAAACGTGSAGDSPETPFPGESSADQSGVSTTGDPENVPDVQGWNTDWSKSTIDLSETGAVVMVKPGVLVQAFSPPRFDADGNLTDETTKELIGKHLDQFTKWILRLAQPREFVRHACELDTSA